MVWVGLTILTVRPIQTMYAYICLRADHVAEAAVHVAEGAQRRALEYTTVYDV